MNVEVFATFRPYTVEPISAVAHIRLRQTRWFPELPGRSKTRYAVFICHIRAV